MRKKLMLRAHHEGEEVRLTKTAVEVRGSKDAPVIYGHGSVFNKLSENLGGFREIIEEGAFDDVLEDDTVGLFNHDMSLLLGRTTAGTMRQGVDKNGLWYEIDPPDNDIGRRVLSYLERGEVTQSSFGFTIARGGETWNEDEDGRLIRTITKVGRLYDQSPVTFPAYPDTDVALRSLAALQESRDGRQKLSRFRRDELRMRSRLY
jgi:HK97 family phage prohead protease